MTFGLKLDIDQLNLFQSVRPLLIHIQLIKQNNFFKRSILNYLFYFAYKALYFFFPSAFGLYNNTAYITLNCVETRTLSDLTRVYFVMYTYFHSKHIHKSDFWGVFLLIIFKIRCRSTVCCLTSNHNYFYIRQT